jgi:hypothetical protein
MLYLTLHDGRNDWKLYRARAAQTRLPRARNRSLSVQPCDTMLLTVLYNSFLRLCSTHWGNMHGLLGHSKLTLHTVIRAILSFFLCVIPRLQGDITDENFVQSVVEKVVPSPAASFISISPSRLALISFSIWPLRCACRMILSASVVANTCRFAEFKRCKCCCPKADV